MRVYGAVAQKWATRDAGERDDPVGLERWLKKFGDANADLLLRRLLVTDDDEVAVSHLQAVADACRRVPLDLLDAVHQRRAAAVSALAVGGLVARAVVITPEWRVVVGHGGASALETSLSLSPTYGVPIFPGSALKGLAAAYGTSIGTVSQKELERLFGSPRPGARTDARQGSVVMLEAVPIERPRVVVDVLTPHVKPYYDSGNANGQPASPPAEYHSPVPIRFLAVSGHRFRSVVFGPSDDVEKAVELLCGGLAELGIGAKTAAGYGYCTAEVTKELR